MVANDACMSSAHRLGPMRVNVRLFASYREAAGVGHVPLELPEGSTARDAIRAGRPPARRVCRASLTWAA